MSAFTLEYFGMPGRGEITRYIAFYGDLDMKNEITSFEDFGKNQKSGKYPYSQLPVITVGNSGPICQSGAIARYAAKLAKIYPTEPIEALYVDEAYEVVIGAATAASTFRLSPEEAAAKIKTWIAGDLARLEHFVTLRAKKDSPYIANGKFSLADVAFFTFISKHKCSDPKSSVTEEIVKTNAPNVWAYVERFSKTPEAEKIHRKANEFYSSL